MALKVTLGPNVHGGHESNDSQAPSQSSGRYSSNPPENSQVAAQVFAKKPPTYSITPPKLSERAIYMLGGAGMIVGGTALALFLATPVGFTAALIVAIVGAVLFGLGGTGYGSYIWTDRNQLEGTTEVKLHASRHAAKVIDPIQKPVHYLNNFSEGVGRSMKCSEFRSQLNQRLKEQYANGTDFELSRDLPRDLGRGDRFTLENQNGDLITAQNSEGLGSIQNTIREMPEGKTKALFAFSIGQGLPNFMKEMINSDLSSRFNTDKKELPNGRFEDQQFTFQGSPFARKIAIHKNGTVEVTLQWRGHIQRMSNERIKNADGTFSLRDTKIDHSADVVFETKLRLKPNQENPVIDFSSSSGEDLLQTLEKLIDLRRSEDGNSAKTYDAVKGAHPVLGNMINDLTGEILLNRANASFSESEGGEVHLIPDAEHEALLQLYRQFEGSKNYALPASPVQGFVDLDDGEDLVPGVGSSSHNSKTSDLSLSRGEGALMAYSPPTSPSPAIKEKAIDQPLILSPLLIPVGS